MPAPVRLRSSFTNSDEISLIACSYFFLFFYSVEHRRSDLVLSVHVSASPIHGLGRVAAMQSFEGKESKPPSPFVLLADELHAA
jgi:hypothetical protein